MKACLMLITGRRKYMGQTRAEIVEAKLIQRSAMKRFRKGVTAESLPVNNSKPQRIGVRLLLTGDARGGLGGRIAAMLHRPLAEINFATAPPSTSIRLASNQF